MFKQSGLLDMLEPVRDAVMVDNGFVINSIGSKTSFPKWGFSETHRIAATRAHMKQAIQRLEYFQNLVEKDCMQHVVHDG